MTLPGMTPGMDIATMRVAEVTIPDDTTPITAAASRTTPSPMTPAADMLAMRATASTVASATTTTKATMDGTPTMAPTMAPTMTHATISNHIAAVPSVPSSPQAHAQVAAMLGSMMAASQLTAKGVTIANMLMQLHKQKGLGQHDKDNKSFAAGSLILLFVDRGANTTVHWS